MPLLFANSPIVIKNLILLSFGAIISPKISLYDEKWKSFKLKLNENLFNFL